MTSPSKILSARACIPIEPCCIVLGPIVFVLAVFSHKLPDFASDPVVTARFDDELPLLDGDDEPVEAGGDDEDDNADEDEELADWPLPFGTEPVDTNFCGKSAPDQLTPGYIEHTQLVDAGPRVSRADVLHQREDGRVGAVAHADVLVGKHDAVGAAGDARVPLALRRVRVREVEHLEAAPVEHNHRARAHQRQRRVGNQRLRDLHERRSHLVRDPRGREHARLAELYWRRRVGRDCRE
ncbi:hypothetical protein HK100_008147 [Physocladia obscura]|uniref:Uncharacterized protein n=1 Tax=Physocladia obscura TaxID=109957 RepID=A0AAD5SU42_9FUNG|nr:hypothetical protein HK100_008147 [Physocladia obscura]